MQRRGEEIEPGQHHGSTDGNLRQNHAEKAHGHAPVPPQAIIQCRRRPERDDGERNEDGQHPVGELDEDPIGENARDEAAWEIDFAGVADAMGSSEEEAQRAVALFNGNCARCHTSGFSAGVPYTQEAGSGGFGPALWDGRPVVQFGDAPEDPEQPDLLIDFLINGSEAQQPYGINGFGNGRMPAFGAILDQDDIELLARYLRSGNLDGKDDSLPGVPSPPADSAVTK